MKQRPTIIERAVRQVCDDRSNLPRADMRATVNFIMDGHAREDEIARLLVGLAEKGETVEEIAGAAEAMRQHMTKIHSNRTDLVDTCGTGGDASGTFNISTAAALVAAAAGAVVPKHGNKSVTSKSGSADALAALGVNVEANLEQVERCLAEVGICFCYAPLMHAAMRHVGPVRKKLGRPTIFNYLGPLCNPAAAPYQVIGVGRAPLQPVLAQSLAMLGSTRAFVVHGCDGLDEFTLAGPTDVCEVRDGTAQCGSIMQPEDFGLATAGNETMLVDGPEASAALILDILSGKPGPPRDITVMNAAAALLVCGKAATPLDARQQVEEAVESGAARDLLERLKTASHA
jgi:anthranilate phosphoribosyltransferase